MQFWFDLVTLVMIQLLTASHDPSVINMLKSSIFERMQTIVKEAHPEEKWEDHPMPLNMVDNVEFTCCLGNDWIHVDDLPRFKAFLKTKKKLLFISSDGVHLVTNNRRKDCCNPADLTIEEPTCQTFGTSPSP